MGVVKQLILTNLLLCFLRLSVCHENISYLKVQNLNTQKVALKGDHIRPYFSNIKFLPVNLSHANQDTKDVNNNIEDKISYENADFNTQKDINQEVSSDGTKSSDTGWRDFDDLQTTKHVNNNIEDKINFENADFYTQKDINQEVSLDGTKSSDTSWRDFDDLQTTKDVNNNIEDKINYENADFYAQKDINQEMSLDETESSDTSWKDFDDLQTTQIKINDIDSSKEPVEFEVPYETISRFNTQMFEPTTSSLVQKPPKISSTINLKLTEADKDIDIFFRTKKDLRGNPSKRNSRNKNAPTKSNPFSELRRLNQSKRKEILEMMAADASANGTNVDEQQFNKETDSIHILHKHINEKSDDYDSGMNCNFENDCRWTWRKDIANGFFITAGGKLAANESGPRFDANEREFGSFLIIHLPLNSGEFDVKSPLIGPTTHSCKLHMNTWQENMENGEIRVVGDKTIDKYPGANDHTQWLVDTVYGKNRKKWENHVMNIGRISSDFTILLEVVPPKNMSGSATVAFDNLQLYRCFVKSDDICTPTQYRCDGVQLCVNSSAICDINEDCALGDDEKQSCHLIPFGGRCNFEEDEWCGWENTEDSRILKWTRHNGSTPTNFTGPDHDHTYMNKTGNYLYVNMLTDGSGFASGAVLKSKTFNPPPRVHGNSSSRYYNSCALRFYLHKTGKHKSGILVQVTELAPAENITTKLYWNFMDDHGDHWVRQVSILPNITHKYYISFEAKKGFRYISDVAIDDVSLSPECFGLNVPSDELQGYNYWNPAIDITPPKDTHPDFQNKTYYKLSTCQAKGRFGPTHPECQKVYNHTDVSIKVLHEAGLTGVQRWIAPVNSFYTFLIAGASGGKGSSGMGSSRGAMVRTVLNLKKGQEVYILVGQEGNSACPKFLGQAVNSSCYGNRNNYSPGKVREVLLTDINDSGGGGGGATYVFVRNRTKEKVPIAIAAGGGGLGLARSVDGENHQGQAINMSVQPTGGNTWGYKSSGPGGGWISVPGELHTPMSGLSLLSGGIGGKACYNSTDGRGDGGFGGGGGGCKNGGGGGGYRGGDANSTNGDGGISYLDPNRGVPNLAEAHSGYNAGPGYAVIIPAVEGCDCMYMCVALDERRSKVSCVCPGNWKLAEDKKSCTPGVLQVDADYPVWFIGILIGTVICLTLAFCTFCFFLYNRYQARHSGIMRRKMIPGPDFQLDRLRLSSDNMMTEYNPNYEWAGSVYTVKDLKEIPREQLRLIKALGQGAFGEVYQGCYRQRPGDTLELAVAVKTLPEMSTNQAEMDFLMEALIMSKFNHPNIVHFIGVCFDKHPRFIVLELLGGGDLKNFLRECRPKPERSSPLRMKDLVLISIDIAKGCNYLEENRFIHRDIAARNCLLTTKGPGRVVKIADFGMSRDVYRSDYYRKGGKAMLPIKWMPPEAFLDGIFTSKTDVWSFGVLLWEIFRMGFMPYTGCTNKEVMDLVVQGGRLEQPENCPGPIFGIMRQCWHPNPEDRPTFALILERLGYCAQDPEIMSSQLPIFQMVPPSETDTTIMRPSDSEEILKVVANPDYLLPNEAILTTPDVMESTSSVEKLLPEKDNWETPFILPSSKSTQPLLIDNVRGDEENKNVENSSTTKTTPIQNSIPHNNNFMLRNDATVKSGVALDASVLAKNVMGVNAVKKYANINQDGNVALSNGIISNRSRNNYVKNEEETTY